MSNNKKHIDVVGSIDEFTTNYESGLYVEPWVVYVGDLKHGYDVLYSSNATESFKPDYVSSITKRIDNLEEEKVFCYESEYDELITKGHGWVTNVDGTRNEVEFDSNKMYYIYEDGEIEAPDQSE